MLLTKVIINRKQISVIDIFYINMNGEKYSYDYRFHRVGNSFSLTYLTYKLGNVISKGKMISHISVAYNNFIKNYFILTQGLGIQFPIEIKKQFWYSINGKSYRI